LKIAQSQGIGAIPKEQNGRSSSRGFTIGSADDSEWLAEIYVDVELTKDRWLFDPKEPVYGADRILIGAPLWIRSASPGPITLYHAKRKG
jgi:hypothetical protein